MNSGTSTLNNSTIIKDPPNYARAIMVTIRAVIFIVFIFSFDGIVDFGTSPYLISLLSTLGILFSNRISETPLLTRGFLFGFLLLWIGYFVGSSSLTYIFASSGHLKTFLLTQHVELSLISFSIGAISTWFFFRWRHFLTLEIFIMSGVCVYLLAPHRDYHLDSPQFINTLAWQFGVEPQSMLLICAGALVGSLMLLLAFAEARERKIISHEERELRKTNWAMNSFATILVFFIIFALGQGIYNRYDTSKGLISNGVGEGGEEGSSPLGFHSALGSTNQPAALVRLEGDYSQNSYTPMLYMREGALSEFSGNELVIASKKFDTDINNTTPTQLFTGIEDPALKERVEVVHSVYLLSDQKAAFAIDYPISIKQLKNPDPKRFKSAYRAYSLAPGFKLTDLNLEAVGDPRWTKEVLEHYLVPHPDVRYRDLALRLTANIPSPAQKAQSLVDYLNTNSIYTLTPKHDTKPGEDPVAPYLFGDLRGYCVHFAHATVFMLRALGIPARIATGFLTDLSQSKDGHILLRMSDRHAWAEVYFAGYGWVPYDTQPEQVESAAETNVDMGLLEELMGKLDPGEEILPKDILKDEANITPIKDIYLPSGKDVSLVLVIMFILIILAKLYLHYSWLLPGSSKTKLYRAFRSIIVSLYEIGFNRLPGETYKEYRVRLIKDLKVDPLALSETFTEAKYRSEEKAEHRSGNSFEGATKDLLKLRHQSSSTLSIVPFWKRAIGFINPLTLMGGRI